MPLTHVCVWDSKIGYRRITVMEYYEMKEDGGKTVMTGNSNKMAFQIPEELFQQIKWHPALPLGRRLGLSALAGCAGRPCTDGNQNSGCHAAVAELPFR